MRRRSQKSGVKPLFSKKVIWVIFTTMVISLITIPNLKPKANDANVIRLLEIEPGNNFRLNSVQASGSNPAVEVTHMDMPTFISKIEEIDGTYDVVYIGRSSQNLSKYWNIHNIYRDYSQPLKQEWGSSDIGYKGKDQPNTMASKTLWYGTNGRYNYNDDNNSWDKIVNAKSGYVSAKIGNDTRILREYYSENDITNKRADEIKKMIDSNQLVYIDSSIFSGDLQGTNLQKNFNNTSQGNYQVINSGEISTDKIIQDYNSMENTLKRPKINLNSSPVGDVTYDAQGNAKVETDINKRANNRCLNFTFNLKDSPSKDVQYKAALYMDYNGDGLYSEETTEKVIPDFNVDPNHNNTLRYNVPGNFVGYLNWKLVIYSTQDANIKANLTGGAVFKLLSNDEKDKIKINVLQIGSLNRDKDGNISNKLDLSTDSNFNKALHNDLTDDYNIHIDYADVSYLNEGAPNCLDDYNMIIMGFDDSYGNCWGNNLNENGVNLLQTFINKKKSLMLTHDTISLSALGQTTIKGHGNSSEQGGTLFTQRLKDLVGQSRYVDPFVNSDNPYIDVKNHDPYNSNDNSVTLGATAFSSLKLYNLTMTNKVKNINSAQITSYPYKLSDEIGVSKTHTQWYQLNLEDPDLVPWYNLEYDSACHDDNNQSAKFNSGDSRNFYYTYSVRNITYSGTGHSNQYSSNEKELQLFVNTIIKADRGANKAPVITNYKSEVNSTTTNNDSQRIDDESTIENVNPSVDFKFRVNLFDIDSLNGDVMKLSVNVGGVELYPEGDILYQRDINSNGGTNKEFIIPSEMLEKNVGKSISVTVQGWDIYTASSTKTFTLNIADDKVDIRHGVDLSNSNKAQKVNWNQQNIDSYISPNNTKVNENYYSVVPFASRINMYNADGARITLTLDSKFSPYYNPNNPIASINTSYVDTANGYYAPTVYVVKADGTLIELQDGEMKTDNSGLSYYYDISKADVISKGANIVDGRCNIVVKYYGKTYYQNSSNDKTATEYKNTISLSRNNNTSSLDAKITVGFNKVKGILY